MFLSTLPSKVVGLPKLISATVSGATLDGPKVVAHNARYHKCTPPTSPALGCSEEPAPGMYQAVWTATGFSILVPPSAANASFEESIRWQTSEATGSGSSSLQSKEKVRRSKVATVSSRARLGPVLEVGSKKLGRVKTLMSKRVAKRNPDKTQPLMLAMQNNHTHTIAASLSGGPNKTRATPKSGEGSSSKHRRPALLDTKLAREYESKAEENESPLDSPGPVTPLDEAHQDTHPAPAGGKRARSEQRTARGARQGTTHIAGFRGKSAARWSRRAH